MTSTSTNTNTSANTTTNTNLNPEQDKSLHTNTTTASPGKSPKPLIQSLSSNTTTSTNSIGSTSTSGAQPLHLSHNSSSESSGTNLTSGLEFSSPKNLSTTSPSANAPTNTNTESGTTPTGQESSTQKQSTLKNTLEGQDQKDFDERQEILQESKTNLVINYIPADMNEGTLGTLFSPFGTMLNIKIVVDPHTGRSRGYGFVKYESEESATRAQEALNGLVIGNKKLKVAYSRPQSKDIQNSNLYVTNVPSDWKNQQLGEVFKPFGYVIESRILLDQDGKSRGAGFVRMDSHANALKAIAGAQGVSGLVVKLAQKKNQNRRWGADSNGGNNNMNQGNDYDNRNFGHRGHGRRSGGMVNQGGDHNRHMFQGQMPGGTYGKRNSSDRRQFYRPRGGSMGDPSSNGEGFYHPSHHSFAPQPMTGIEPYYGQGMSSNVMREPGIGSSGRSAQTNPRGYSPQSYNIVVQNLPEHYNVDHLIKLYAPYGPIQSVHIQKPSRHGNAKSQMSYGIVSYFFADDAKNAIEQTDRRQEGNRILHVTWQ